jgi:predicted dehydrogenase
MGVSHLALVNSHPEIEVAAICDTSSYVLGILEKYTGLTGYSSYDTMLRDVELDAVVIATPSSVHADAVRTALTAGLHVFCEKPLTLDPVTSAELTDLARERNLVTQVGYHNRFVGAFEEVRRLLDWDAIGEVTHALGEAYGPVVLKPTGGTWRSRRDEGGGCLHDYAAHPIDLLTWYLGEPIGVGGTALRQVFSQQTTDEVFSTVYFDRHRTAQVSVNWCDESERKMSTTVTLWGTNGKITADRQECRTYLRNGAHIPPGYQVGWNVRYTTDLTAPVGFYLRGEEYSAQIEYFVESIQRARTNGINNFGFAATTDRVIAALLADSDREQFTPLHTADSSHPVRPRRFWSRARSSKAS